MERDFLEQLFRKHTREENEIPNSSIIVTFTEEILKILFPVYGGKRFDSINELRHQFKQVKTQLRTILESFQDPIRKNSGELTNLFFLSLPEVYSKIESDIRAIEDGDPAALSQLEVIRTYPGFYAIALYRIAHEFHTMKIPVMPRIITEYAHSRTGIDIHPAAKIGYNFCIDHGTGIVIGETSVIGNNVKLYQGVTLGALSVDKKMVFQKRHPTIEDDVVIYSNATILGGNTCIGSNSIIGGNVWLTKSVPSYTKIYHNPQITIERLESVQ